MKYILALITLLLSISCHKKEETPRFKSEFDFLLGDWERTNTKDGVIAKEHWQIVSNTQYKGHGYSIEKKDTTFQERMHLYKKDSIWTLEISGPNEDAVPFTITNSTNNSLRAQNPKHDFPTKIEYFYFDNTLTAQVSNEEVSIPFIFWRLEN